jgi:hypothetical protein
MTPEQRIKRHILKEAIEHNDDLNWDGDITAHNVDEAWQTVLLDNNAHWDYVSQFRDSGEDTRLPSQWSRNYEAKEVARQLSDGTWVGWTYWHGGGKWGEPEAIDWMNESYDVEVRQETRIVNVFAKKEVVA